ncbi:MAG: hypothetical protein H0T10_08180 [Actinobacteria bacterium]|nr:hypothetical protein [Actinomycetota bacterium]
MGDAGCSDDACAFEPDLRIREVVEEPLVLSLSLGDAGPFQPFGIMPLVLTRVWNSRLTWSAAIPVTAVLCLAIVATAGIGGTPGAVALISSVVGWLLLLSRMSDNEARHALAVASANGRTAPMRSVRRLFFPWWGRAVLGLGALGITLAAIAVFESDGLIVLIFALAFVAGRLVERAVTAVRARHATAGG